MPGLLRQGKGKSMKKMMAVYDADTRYAERLSDYVNRKERGVFTAQAFTSKEKLAEYAAKHEIDVLLSGERTDSGDISEIPSGQKIYCLLYTSDAADEEDSVDLGGRRIIKKKKTKE